MRKRLFSKKKSSKQIAVYSEPKIPTGAFPQEENSNRLVNLDESIDLDASRGVTSSEPEITHSIGFSTTSIDSNLADDRIDSFLPGNVKKSLFTAKRLEIYPDIKRTKFDKILESYFAA